MEIQKYIIKRISHYRFLTEELSDIASDKGRVAS